MRNPLPSDRESKLQEIVSIMEQREIKLQEKKQRKKEYDKIYYEKNKSRKKEQNRNYYQRTSSQNKVPLPADTQNSIQN